MFRRYRRFFEHARHLVTGGPIAVFQQLFGFVVHGLQIQLCVSWSSFAISLRLLSSVISLLHLSSPRSSLSFLSADQQPG